MYVQCTHHFTHTQLSLTLLQQSPRHISALQAHIHIWNMVTFPHTCASIHSHKHTFIHTDRCVQTHKQTEYKSNKNSYKDKRLCSSLLSSLNDSAQRHELNLGLSPTRPNAREGTRFGPPTRESVCLQSQPRMCVSCSNIQGFQLHHRSLGVKYVDLLSQVLQKKLLFPLLDV